MHRRSIPTTLALLTFTAAAACAPRDERASGGDSASAAAASGAAATTAATTTAATTTAAAPNVVTVHARDFAFDAPKEIPAGMTTFRLVNDGETFHHVQIIRLDSAKTIADFEQAMKNPGPPPRWAVFAGGPNAPSPKGESNATLDMTPGNYAMFCFVDVPGGVPHVMKGMAHAFTVTPAASSGATAAAAAAPSPDVVVTLSDYKFELSKPITAGKRTFEVRTAAGQPHEIELIRLAPGKTAKDVLAWIRKPQGPPPGQGIGGTAAAVPGMTQYFTAELTAGDYALICFVPDAKDGKSHHTHGMVQTLKIS